MAGQETTRVAITVIVDVNVADRKEGRNVACMAVGSALAAQTGDGDVIQWRSDTGLEREVRVAGVIDLPTALRQGVLKLVPAEGDIDS